MEKFFLEMVEVYRNVYCIEAKDEKEALSKILRGDGELRSSLPTLIPCGEPKKLKEAE
jgi:hypothetical protein